MIITKYEQSGFLITSQGKTIALDIGNYTPQKTVDRFKDISAVLVSHIHGDHWNEEYARLLGGNVYTVQQVAESVTDPSGLNLAVHKEGDTVKITNTPFTITVLPSDHGPHVSFPVENTALLISDGEKTLYFLGDMFNPAPKITQSYDALLIPVGNSNYTFGPVEAADYIETLDWKGLTVPIHYNGKLDPHTADVFIEEAKDLCTVVRLKIGQQLEI